MASTTQTLSLPEYQENYLKDLLASAKGVGETPVSIPEAQVAGLTPAQQEAIRLGLAGVGAYAPMMEAGEASLGAGAGAIEQGIGTALSGAPLLMGTTGAYDPQSYKDFMDPYTEEVIRATEADIARQGEIAQKGLAGQAVQSGAFGGSRAAVAGAELGRNVADQMARTGAQLRSAGFQQAQQQAQNAFQNQMARQQSAAQLFGALGQGVGALGGQLAKTGLSQAALGESAQAAQQRDINALMSLGGLEQAQAQAELDVGRASALEQQYEPYQRIGFMSDIFRGVPTAQQVTQTSTTPDPGFLQQALGFGTGIAGLSQAGLFGSGGISGLVGGLFS